jgi:adenylate cyclase
MEKSKRNKTGVYIGCLITILIAFCMYKQFYPLETLEDKLLDYRFKIRGAENPSDTVVVAAIDEKSIGKLGRWPWSRDKVAQLIERLSAFGAEIIVSDIFFSESEKNDTMLAKAMKDAGNVILPVVFDFEKQADKRNDAVLLPGAYRHIARENLFAQYAPIAAKGVLFSIPEIAGEAMSHGHINMFPDGDGTIRWESLLIEYNGYLFPSVTVQAAATYLGIPQEKVMVDATQGIQLGKRYIPTDTWGRTLIYYYGSNQTFRHIAISDIIDGSVSADALQGKIVLIGATAVGIYDLRVTPFSPAMPGVEKHANVISAILQNRFLKKASLTVNLITLLASGIVFSLVITRFRAVSASVITAMLNVLFLALGYYLFFINGLWIYTAYPVINVTLIFINITAYNYAVEERYARRIRMMFSSYVTERVVNELIRNPDMARLGGERREVSIIFSDVRGFTSFSEKHAPEEVVAILNEYLKAMTEIVFKWEGTLDKFIGDAILAFWGAPLRQEDHAERAVRCALDMMRRLEELQKKWRSEGKPVLDIGIGVNTGEVLVGNIGAEGMKMDYTVIGDHVNLGSRIEALTRKFEVHILLTGFTLDKVRELIRTGKLGHVSIKSIARVAVKGKDKSVYIYEILTKDSGALSEIIECADESVVVMKEK